MPPYVILESPKFEKRRSTLLDAESSAAQTLRARGWRVVETISDATLGEAGAPEVESHDAFDSVLSEAQLDALRAAGYADIDALRSASDEDLRAVEGIGPATVRNIRRALADEGQA